MDELTNQLVQRAQPDPASAWQNAQTIGAARLPSGERIPGENEISIGMMPTSLGDAQSILDVGSILKNLPKKGLGDAIGTFYNWLSSQRLPPVDPATILQSSRIGGRIAPPTSYGKMLNELTRREPDLSGMFEMPLATKNPQRAAGLPKLYQDETRLRYVTPEQRFDNQLKRGVYDRNAVRPGEDISDAALSQRDAGIKSDFAPQPTLRAMRNGPNSVNAIRLRNSGLTEDDIRKIRTMDIDSALKAYPRYTKPTLNDIIRRNSWNWIK